MAWKLSQEEKIKIVISYYYLRSILEEFSCCIILALLTNEVAVACAHHKCVATYIKCIHKKASAAISQFIKTPTGHWCKLTKCMSVKFLSTLRRVNFVYFDSKICWLQMTREVSYNF